MLFVRTSSHAPPDTHHYYLFLINAFPSQVSTKAVLAGYNIRIFRPSTKPHLPKPLQHQVMYPCMSGTQWSKTLSLSCLHTLDSWPYSKSHLSHYATLFLSLLPFFLILHVSTKGHNLLLSFYIKGLRPLWACF